MLLFLLFFLVTCRFVSSDLSGDRGALLAIYDAVGTRSSIRHLAWNRSSTGGPCDWRGIECSNASSTSLRVYKVRLPGVGLAGAVPQGALSSLTSLRVLSLRSNKLTGPFPDLRNCTQLRALYLQDNHFSGQLPPDFSFWPQLLHLNLAFNNLSGGIPTSINSLHRLFSLNLENNILSGTLAPQLSPPPNLAHFSVANNNLTGPVPQPLRKFSASAFQGNSICGPPLAVPCPAAPAPAPVLTNAPPPPVSTRNKGKKLSSAAIAGIVVASVAAAAILLLCCWFLLRSRKRATTQDRTTTKVSVRTSYSKNGQSQPAVGTAGAAGEPESSSKDLEDYSSSVQGDLVANKLVFFDAGRRSSYDLEDLLRASAEVLGKGSIGTTYKAVLEDGTTVAVKRLKDVATPRNVFEQQMQTIGSFKHRNVVPLRAYYYSKDEKLLVSDYMPRGSLSALLHGNRGVGRTPLDWPSRLRIAYGAAKGISYMHSHSAGFVHGSIKSSNVLLAKDFEACVSDGGLVHLVSNNSSSGGSSRMLGYRAPEVAETRKVTQKSDVYSFGVLLLELLTGRSPTQASLNEEGIDLPRWVQSVVREEWTAEVFDLELMRYQNIEEELVQMLQLAMNCTSASADHRPNMKQVVNTIQDLARSGEDVSPEEQHTSEEKSTSGISESR